MQMACFTTPPLAMQQHNGQPPNPPIHHFSTVIYPSSSTISTAAHSLDELTYGRLGSPANHRLEAALSTHFATHATLLTPSKQAALLSALTPFLSAHSTLSVPPHLPADLRPAVSLLQRLGVAVLSSASADAHAVLQVAPHAPLFVPLPPSPVGKLVVLYNVGNVIPPRRAMEAGVDIVVGCADRSGGLLDSDTSLLFGYVTVSNERVYRRVRSVVRTSLAPAAGTPSASDTERALLAMRSASARKTVQLASVATIVRFLRDLQQHAVSGVWSLPQSTDIGMQLHNPQAFLDSLSVFRIADAVGSGSSTSYAWPFPFPTDHPFDKVVLSVGLEDPQHLINDIRNALAISAGIDEV